MESRNPKEDFSSPGSSSEGATSYACFICFMSFPAHHGCWNSLWSPSTKSPSQLKEFIFHCSIVQSTWSWRIFFFACSPLFKATWLLGLHSFLQVWNMELFLISNAPTSIAEKSLQFATEMARSLTLPQTMWAQGLLWQCQSPWASNDEMESRKRNWGTGNTIYCFRCSSGSLILWLRITFSKLSSLVSCFLIP